MQISGRFLTSGGNPFVWIGDTGWRLYKLTPAQITAYMKDRHERGFTVIEGPVIVHNMNVATEDTLYDGVTTNKDITSLNATWMNHIDFIISEADRFDLYIAPILLWNDLLSTWTVAQLDSFGETIGTRYANNDNVVWLSVGEAEATDNSDKVGTDHDYEVDALIEGIDDAGGLMAGDTGNKLITIHSNGNDSTYSFTSAWPFTNGDYLSFHNSQMGQSQAIDGSYSFIATAYAGDTKPMFCSEAGYEQYLNASSYRWITQEVRYMAYTGIFAGGFGFGHGCNGIWQSYRTGDDTTGSPTYEWDDAMAYFKGQKQLMYLRDIIENRSVNYIPRQELITDAGTSEGSGMTRVQCCKEPSGKWAIIYIADGHSIDVDMTELADTCTTYWLNPRNGIHRTISTNQANVGNVTFKPPSQGCDWVLVIDENSKNYPAP